MKRSCSNRTSSNWLSPKWLRRLFRADRDATQKPRRKTRRASGLESLETRSMMAADTLPVLLVVADQQDFYYQEYGDTRLSLEEAGVEVRVAATTTNRTVPHANTGEPAGTDGGITPDIALSQVNPDDYSAIVFVGGWGSSMYQYAFEGDYQNDAYDGDSTTKETVNELISQFLDADKHVAAICHGVTVLAWARDEGVSPLAGKTVSVPYIGSPPVFYNNTWYGYFQLGQYEQVVDNGAIANTASGQYGDPSTVADDVVVDGRIITAENYDSAREFGRVIAREVSAAAGQDDPPAEDPPAETPRSASPLPVLLVIADQNDFYYREYGDTRLSLEEAGVEVRVAATTTNRSLPHPNTGEPAGTDGGVTPDIALSQVNPDDYSAIAFVGGWGSSMYQYAFEGDYAHDPYDGDLATKQVVNGLINDFLEADKYVAAICHGVTVLAWARVDGVSPLAGKTVSVPHIGSPPVFYQNTFYTYFQLGQYEQIVANGGTANSVSGQYGDPGTAADDVVVDGRIITGENYDSAREFGRVIAREVYAAAGQDDPPAENLPPVALDGAFEIDENSVVGAAVGQVNASDPDAGQTLGYAIVGGNTGGAFAIDNTTGQLTVANPAALDFEATPVFHLQVLVTDDAANPLSDTALMTVQLRDVFEVIPGQVAQDGDDIIAQGTDGNDVVYVWSGAQAEQVFIWINGTTFGPYNIGPGGHVRVFGGSGDDQIFATDVRMAVEIRGEGGHDLITGGSAGDLLDGGDGFDRVYGMAGDDLVLGGAGDDCLVGMEGHDVIVGNDGNDYLEGSDGDDILTGGLGGDYQPAGAGVDIVIGGTTAYDNDVESLEALRQAWLAPGTFAERADRLQAGASNGARLAWGETVFDDDTTDIQCTGADDDLLFASAVDEIWTDAGDRIVSPV